MSDRRKTSANARVLRAGWGTPSDGQAVVQPDPARIAAPLVDLCRAPDGPRDRQLLFGDTVAVLERRDGWAFVQADKDGYVGYLPTDALSVPRQATHRVSAPATHLYPAPDFKTAETAMLPFGARVTVTGQAGRFGETPDGFVPLAHLSDLNTVAQDPVAMASLFVGAPYLWGGNSWQGIDCSGLVQIAMLACGIPCDGDSDQQERALGEAQPKGSPMLYGDLLFWKGHVGLVAGATLLHANAFHMAVAYEPLSDAINRIAAQGDGPVTSHRRIRSQAAG